MKVKLCVGWKESDINEWLINNPNIVIRHIGQSEGGLVTTISIWYEDDPFDHLMGLRYVGTSLASPEFGATKGEKCGPND